VGAELTDIFEIWSQIGAADTVHPADRSVLKRTTHESLTLDCLPAAFMGPLRTARVVLLFLSFRYREGDAADAKRPEAQKRYQTMRSGYQSLPGKDEWEHAHKWWQSRVKQLGDFKDISSKIAIFNIAAYHATTFPDVHLLAALPSSRVSLGWAQEHLFPEAEQGKRLVVCLRAQKYWGLDKQERYGRALFAPKVNRGGYMYGETRNSVREIAEHLLQE